VQQAQQPAQHPTERQPEQPQQQQGQQQEQSQPQSTQPQPAPRQHLTSEGSAELYRVLDAAKLRDLTWPNFAAYKPETTRFYRSLAGLAWIADSQPTPQAREMIQIFQRADEKGLDPKDYDALRWKQRLAVFDSTSQQNSTAEVRFDLALTICAMRYLADVSGGRMNPRAFGFELYLKPNPDAAHISARTRSQRKLYLGDFLREQVIDGTSLDTVIAQIEPQFPEYQRTEQALKTYLQLSNNQAVSSSDSRHPKAGRDLCGHNSIGAPSRRTWLRV